MNGFQLIALSNNLGDSKSLATHPATTTHMRIGEEERARLGITDGVIRVSIGLEDVDDIKDDLRQALGRACRRAAGAGGGLSHAPGNDLTGRTLLTAIGVALPADATFLPSNTEIRASSAETTSGLPIDCNGTSCPIVCNRLVSLQTRDPSRLICLACPPCNDGCCR